MWGWWRSCVSWILQDFAVLLYVKEDCLARIDPRDAMVVLAEFSNDTTRLPGLQAAVCQSNSLKLTPLHVSIMTFSDRCGRFSSMDPGVDVLKHFIMICPVHAHLHLKDSKGRTPIICLAENRVPAGLYRKMVKAASIFRAYSQCLLERDLDTSFLSCQDDELNTALHYIAMCGSQPASC